MHDGGAVAMYHSVRGLAEAGWDIHLLALNTRKHAASPVVLDTIVSRVEAFDKDTSINPAKALLYYFSTPPYLVRRFIHSGLRSRALRLMSDGAYDACVVDSVFMGWLIPDLRKCGKPVFLRAHNVENEIWMRLSKNQSSPVKRAYFERTAVSLRKWEHRIARTASHVLAITDRDAEAFRRMGNGNVYTYPAGVDTEEFSPLADVEKDIDILFFGSLEWEANVEAIHWFAERVWPKFVGLEVQWTIAGRNPDGSVRKLAELDSSIVLLPNVESAVGTYRRARILVVPLLSGGGMRLKILEAMAAGVAIVTTSLGIEGIEAQHGAHVMIADDAEQMYNTINFLLGSAEMCDMLGAMARQLAEERYSWSSSIRGVDEYLRRAIEHKSPAL